MKTLKIFMIVLVLAVGSAKAQFTKAELQVNGLTCSMCSKATEKSLRSLNFISDVKADLNRNIFLLTFKNDVPVNLDLISKKVQGAGFFVNNLKATFNFDKVKIANNYFNYDGNTYQLVNAADKALTGPVALTVIDKGFAPASVYKKYMKPGEGSDVKTGRVYHIII